MQYSNLVIKLSVTCSRVSHLMLANESVMDFSRLLSLPVSSCTSSLSRDFKDRNHTDSYPVDNLVNAMHQDVCSRVLISKNLGSKYTVNGVKHSACLAWRVAIRHEPISTGVHTQNKNLGEKTTVPALPHTHQP